MKRVLLGLIAAGLMAVAPNVTKAADFVVQAPIQQVGWARPWRGWGVYRPYGAPLGYNTYAYGTGNFFRPYYSSYYRPYTSYYYRPYTYWY
jgi:hypothetical protein